MKTAAARRKALFSSPDTRCFRVVNAEGDGFPNVTVDLFNDVAIVSLYAAMTVAEENALVKEAAEVTQARAVYLKRRPKEARVEAVVNRDATAPETPARGDPVDELVTVENGLQFLIRPGQGLSVGLYLDMRDTRTWLGRVARKKTVLNCFSYTCGFGVAALAGGATRAVNLDLSRKVLDWGEANAQLNGRTADKRDHISGDVFDWLLRFKKKGETFDIVVLDPPSFAKGKKGVFSAGKDYARLAELAAQVVTPGGMLLACCNLSQLSADAFDRMASSGAAGAGRRLHLLKRLGPSPVDFPAPPGKEPALKAVAWTVEEG